MSIRIGDGFGFGFGAKVLRGAQALFRAWDRRRVVGRLGALDDRMLADIGISRHDVVSALAEPLFADPSEKLAERARETRRARRASARVILMAEADAPLSETPRHAA